MASISRERLWKPVSYRLWWPSPRLLTAMTIVVLGFGFYASPLIAGMSELETASAEGHRPDAFSENEVPIERMPVKQAPVSTKSAETLAPVSAESGNAKKDGSAQVGVAAESSQDEKEAASLGTQPTATDESEPPSSSPSEPATVSASESEPGILSLQEYTERQQLKLRSESGDSGSAVLINLNRNIGRWYLLRLEWPKSKTTDWYHLELSQPGKVELRLDSTFKDGLQLVSKDGKVTFCDLWSEDNSFKIKLAKYHKKPFANLCENLLFLRNQIEGYRTTKEWVVEFLRDNFWAGEAITNFVKDTIYKDKYFIDSEERAKLESQTTGFERHEKNSPPPGLIDEKFRDEYIQAEDLGIDVIGTTDGNMRVGKWYSSKIQKGVFLTAIEAQAIDQQILDSYTKYVKSLDPVEAKAINYLIAFDMSQFKLHFSVGTEHPRVGWSARARPEYRSEGIGPDGIDTIAPVVGTGLIPPFRAKDVVATFTGGFKRSHGAFKWGPLAKSNNSHHYGFMENGVLMSRIQTELATLFIDREGKVGMKTWEAADNERLPSLVHIRQNGVPIISYDEDLGKGIPAEFVSNWTLGNWSGSQDQKFRTLRAGICTVEHDGRQFLVYGYFSSVTPTAMARIFQAYQCQYGMHLDMNALEHTYLSLYDINLKKDATPNQLIKGMKVLDERFKGNVPRFVGYPDNRDFFYLTRD